MNKTTNRKPEVAGNIAVNLTELMALLNCGRCTAEKIAAASGAKIKIGRRCLYHVGKIEKYLETLTEDQSEGA